MNPTHCYIIAITLLIGLVLAFKDIATGVLAFVWVVATLAFGWAILVAAHVLIGGAL